MNGGTAIVKPNNYEAALSVNTPYCQDKYCWLKMLSQSCVSSRTGKFTENVLAYLIRSQLLALRSFGQKANCF